MQAGNGNPRVRAMARATATAAFILIGFRGLWAALPGDALLDFGSFVASGRAAAQSQDAYGIHPLTFHVVLPGFESFNPNLNPPISVLVFQLFDIVDPHTGFRIWWAVSLLCYAATVALLVRRYGRSEKLLLTAWAFALAGFWDTLVLGQIYLPLVLMAAIAWLSLERGRWRTASLLIGLVIAFKPNFLVWPAVLLLAGHGRTAVGSFAAAALISLLPMPIYGAELYARWIELVLSDSGRAAFLTNVSMIGLTARMERPWLGSVLGLLLLAGVAVWAWRRRPPAVPASELALVAALLASPLAWVHYTLFLMPVILRNRRSAPMCLAAVMLTVPVWTVLRLLTASPWAIVTVGSLYAWATVLVLVALLAREGDPAASPAEAAVA